MYKRYSNNKPDKAKRKRVRQRSVKPIVERSDDESNDKTSVMKVQGPVIDALIVQKLREASNDETKCSS